MIINHLRRNFAEKAEWIGTFIDTVLGDLSFH